MASSAVLTVAYPRVHQSDVPRWDHVAQRGYPSYGFDPRERQLAYARSQTFLSHPWLRRVEATLSLQRSVEGRFRQRKGESLEVRERDEVETLGIVVEARSEPRAGWRATSGVERSLRRGRVAVGGGAGPPGERGPGRPPHRPRGDPGLERPEPARDLGVDRGGALTTPASARRAP